MAEPTPTRQILLTALGVQQYIQYLLSRIRATE